VLIVESDASLRGTLAEILQSEGYAVVVVTDVAAARSVLARVRPVAVLLDLRMADESSEPLLAELSGIVNPQATVVVSSSAMAMVMAGDYGVLSVPKPFELEELLDVLRRAISNGMALLESSPKRRSDPEPQR
jgi:DNA-binding response OmpR family regulator